MPPKPPAGSASSSAASSGSGSGSGSGSSSSSSGSSSSGSGSGSSSSSDSDDDNSGSSSSSSGSSESSEGSQASRRSTRSRSRASSVSSAASSHGAKKKSSKSTGSKKSKSGEAEGAKKASEKGKSKASTAAKSRVAPKKSATAKPLPKSKEAQAAEAAAAAASAVALSENSEESDYGHFSLSKFKTKLPKRAPGSVGSTAPSSANTTPRPQTGQTPSGHTPSSHTFTSSPAAPPKSSSSASSSSKAAIESLKKKKSGGLFSASSASDSDSAPAVTKKKVTGAAKRAAASSPPRAGQKAKAATAQAKKSSAKSAPPPKRTTRSSSVSSEGSTSSSLSSKLSRSSSDSSDSEVILNTPHKSQKVSAAALTAAARKKKASGATLSAAAKKKAAATAKAKKIKAAKSAAVVPKDADTTDTETESPKAVPVRKPTTRQARSGGAPRKSKHITGKKSLVEHDTDSEDAEPGGGASSPRKRASAGAKAAISSVLPPVRRDLDGLDPIETRKCPVSGCDSSGHLGGRMDRHFMVHACPVFHNSTRKVCKEARQEANRKQEKRKKALTEMSAKSPTMGPSGEQKKYARSVKEARSGYRESNLPDASTEEPPEDKEVDLVQFASDWDLKLFKEAQALAAEDLENSLKGLPDSKSTRYIEMGKHEMEVWYQSPYPEEFTNLPRIYICEFCLKPMKSRTVLKRHAAKCVWKHPPGDEIYRKDKLSVFEICGKRCKLYCQSLCLLAKFFLDHKTLYFDVEPFLFYVMTTADTEGCHIVGYFSKEKNSSQNFNVSCILTLPPYQRQGYGRLLIDFSYLLSREEKKIGSPEKPLSDLGLITYRAYWKDIILEHICNYPDREISVKSFSEKRGINTYDIISTLQYEGMIKYWKGQHVILKKEDLIEDYLRKVRSRPKGRQIYQNALIWKPYEPTAKERRQAEQIKKNQEERQKKR